MSVICVGPNRYLQSATSLKGARLVFESPNLRFIAKESLRGSNILVIYRRIGIWKKNEPLLKFFAIYGHELDPVL